ncbi:MAG TPA: SUMF1/EgtB/PvdO family nonheme iron enzyme, partial [Polyangiaceae bacterium]|nr:SUMF1/EgtB/PvdO family nonheme iron enzyme [Polyangiaceae bacterium]
LRGRANRDGTALVGGPERGLFLELSGGLLRASSLDSEGALTALREAPSAVRAGFDACERGRGGALVVGPSAADPSRLVALTVGAAGETSSATALPVTLAPGGGVHLAPRPGGGAWLFLRDDRAERVLWLDDDGRVEGDAALPVPAELERAPCLDGRRAPRVPSPTPGRLVTPEGLDAPDACLVGDVGWADEGREARWIGSATRGLDAIPELGVARVPDEGPPSAPAGPPAHAAPEPAPGPPPAPPPARCPGDMVSIAGRFCVDRFEAHLVDARTLEPLSPDYPLSPAHLARALEWTTARWRTGDVHAQALPLPLLPALHASGRAEPLARSERGARPSGYVSGHVAEAACLAAGKRLCSREEHRVACRGEADASFPYGSQYMADACNVFRAEHPAARLHGNASVGHLDPRLNRVEARGEALLRAAGATATCRSAWGADAVYDLVGNLDEWVADPKGAFVGGFYARSTRAGCGATVSAHPPSYADYSTGVRCCRDAAPASR